MYNGLGRGEKKIIMPIVYYKLLKKLEENGYSSYKCLKENILGQKTLTSLKRGEGGLSKEKLEMFCKMFKCQPGDLMEYIEDENE